MKSRLLRERARLVLLAALAAGATTFPIHAADGTLGQARQRVEIGAEIWRLRPSQSSAPVLGGLPNAVTRTGAAAEIPQARRTVRMVYPALVEAR